MVPFTSGVHHLVQGLKQLQQWFIHGSFRQNDPSLPWNAVRALPEVGAEDLADGGLCQAHPYFTFRHSRFVQHPPPPPDSAQSLVVIIWQLNTWVCPSVQNMWPQIWWYNYKTDLQPGVSWCRVHSWTPFCANHSLFITNTMFEHHSSSDLAGRSSQSCPHEHWSLSRGQQSPQVEHPQATPTYRQQAEGILCIIYKSNFCLHVLLWYML